MCTYGSPVDGNEVHSVLETTHGGREWSSCPQGLITFVPAGFPLKWNWTYRSESIHLTMPPSFVTIVGKELENGGDSHCPELKPHFRIMDNRLRSLLHQLRQESRDNELGSDLVTSSLLRLVAAQLYRLSNASPGAAEAGRNSTAFSVDSYRKSIEILNDRLHEKLSLSELAAELELSPFHFAREFKRATGFPPHEYRLQLRVARARELLRQKPLKTVATIACELGFSDESHFRRHFKRIVGTTPSKFRGQR